MTTIVHKRGTGIPAADDLAVGEIAIDTSTGTVYTKNTRGEVVPVGGDFDTSNLAKLDESNDVIEGQFRLIWDHSADVDFPFNGSIGYDGNNKDPDSPGGAFLYASGKRGTVSIGRDGDMELHGQSEIKGVADREGNLPWITDFSYVQAADFLDAEGNSIIGGGGGITAEFDPEFVYLEPWKGEEVGGGPVWVVEDGLSASFLHTAGLLSAKRAELGEVSATTVNTHAPFYGSVSSAFGNFTEATILGGINIPAVDVDRPEELPFDLSDEEVKALKDKTRSIQYALTVTHETLGRTVEIDKEGVIRAREFTDMDGNPIGGGGTELPEGSSDGSVLTWQTDAWKPSQRFRFQEKPTNEIVADTSGITLAATDVETKLDLTMSGFEFSHGYEPARVWIKKNPYESDPSELHVDQVFATDYLDADGNPIGGGDVDLTGYATETWVSTNYQTKGNYLVSADLNGYATETWVTNGYQPKGNYLTDFTESDPTVPAWVKSITQNDIDNWNSAGGDFDNSHVVGDESKKNVAVGLRALRDLTEGSNNTATGTDALSWCTTGIGNTAYGSECLTFLESGEWNTAVGVRALKNSSSAKHNSVFGYQAAYNLRTGRDNVAIGSKALESSTGGNQNVAVGSSALKNNGNSFSTAIGYDALVNSVEGENTAVGHQSLQQATTGSLNVAVGNSAMASNVEGASNTVIGRQAGFWITGNKNSVLGAEAGPNYGRPDIENTTCVGYGAETIESNTIKLGNRDITRVITDGAMQASDYLDADGNPATVSPSAIVEAFTTLQTAVADEDTVEGIKTALTNALGGLIEKFEGMTKQ